MGTCEACTREAEYNAVDSEDIMTKLQKTDLGEEIVRLRSENKQSIVNFKFIPMQDKSFYKGKLSGTKRQGYGENYAGCFNYYGFFKNDLPHGQGAIVTEKYCFVGHFAAGVLQGKGKQYNEGVIFEGTYLDGEKVEGRLFSDEASYTGSFKNGVYSGKGVLVVNKSVTYEGQFKNGLFHGAGSLTFDWGCKYKGGFKDGLYQGFGQYSWPNGNFYRGQYKGGKRQGFGVLKIGGIEYSGTWHNGVREGHGILAHEQELAFGNWHNNLLVEQ